MPLPCTDAPGRRRGAPDLWSLTAGRSKPRCQRRTEVRLNKHDGIREEDECRRWVSDALGRRRASDLVAGLLARELVCRL